MVDATFHLPSPIVKECELMTLFVTETERGMGVWEGQAQILMHLLLQLILPVVMTLT